MTENKRFRIYQDLYEDFYIEDIESYNNQKLQRSYKVGNEEDVKYENVENIVDLLNEQEEEIQSLKERKESLHKTIASLDECQKGKSHYINQLVKENKQLKQQCRDFMEMLNDMSIAYLLNEELEYILGLTDYEKWVKKQTKRGKEL